MNEIDEIDVIDEIDQIDQMRMTYITPDPNHVPFFSGPTE